MRIAIGVVSTYLILSLFSTVAAHAQSSVIGAGSREELSDLGRALTKISGEDCASIEEASGKFQLDTLRCLPAPLRRLMGETQQVDGPNCYNLANMTSGLQLFVRYVSETESDYVIDPKAGYCKPVTRAPEPGDYVMIVGKAKGLTQPIHSYIYLNEKYAVTKNGSEKSEPWKIGLVDEIRSKFMSASNYVGDPKDHTIEVTYYKCAAKGESANPAIRALSKPLEAFGHAMETPILKRPMTAVMVREIRQALQGVKKAFGAPAIKALNSSKDHYEVSRPLIELYSHIATFGQIDISESGRFENAKVASDFAKLREEYAAIVRDVVTKTDSVGLISPELQ